jgi:hypothetical protein
MTLNFGGAAERNCQKRAIQRSGNAITVDSVCQFGEMTTTSHATVTGDFNSAYTVEVNSTRQGGRPIPGVAPGGETRMTIAAKWLGPCTAGQKPGDVMMGSGMKMNVLDIQKMNGAPAQLRRKLFLRCYGHLDRHVDKIRAASDVASGNRDRLGWVTRHRDADQIFAGDQHVGRVILDPAGAR